MTRSKDFQKPTFCFSKEPDPAYLQACRAHGTFFHSPEWQRVLKMGFGAQPLYGWDSKIQNGGAMTIFKLAFFKIGYLGFPAGGTVTGQPLNDDFLHSLLHAQYTLPLHVIRLTPSPALDRLYLNEKSEKTWETVILDLQNWSLSDLSSSIRRNIGRAQTSLSVAEARSGSDVDRVYLLYKATIQRHGGNLRYTRAYFNELIGLCGQSDRLYSLLAFFEQELAGFIIVAYNGQTAYYLHGGIAKHLQKYRASDLLFATSIERARDSGMSLFNFMASPLEQKSLVKYKEKWGGETRMQHTFNIRLSKVHGVLFQVLYQCYKFLKKRR
jgi:hypothetical protein